ncbi:protein BRANCHLESS TRICHOME [Solanum lycopersicum]|uniref:protein BRANCHLESS TRICHOME n=1 Tax=Solanum lycopersicum TaxID=4081 RepID=UPI000276ACEC|nr:protein BRANCHLESS TRICHOME [Solanum lycopersicum]
MRRQENNKSIGILEDHIIPPCICPTWKLYENPFYNSLNNPLPQHKIHRLNLPISARKIASSFWDLTFMDCEVAELKAKVEDERKARKKLETVNKKIARELCEEKKGRQALERVCKQLANHISLDKAEIDGLRKDMEEERKMVRVAEVMREERVQMKLTEAKYLLEDKLLELERLKTEQSKSCNFHDGRNHSKEAENPHIKRGIKGFVEFPKVVRAISSKSRHWSTKLECQKARLLLKQKSPPIPSNALLTTS